MPIALRVGFDAATARAAAKRSKDGPQSRRLLVLAAIYEGVFRSHERKSGREWLTLIRIFEELRGLGYTGGYDAVRRHGANWRKKHGAASGQAYIPLTFAPGEAYQFDWSHDIVLMDGVTTTVKESARPPLPQPDDVHARLSAWYAPDEDRLPSDWLIGDTGAMRRHRTGDMSPIEIITSREKRQYWGRSEKRRWVEALEEPGANASEIARAAGVSTSLHYCWRQQLAGPRKIAAFVPVTVAPEALKPEGAPARSTISIAFGASVRMTIEGVPNARTLSAVIGALKAPDRR